MAFDFPSAPTAGAEYTSGGITYVWDGLVWNIKGGGDLTDYVLKTGDNMSGGLKLIGDGTQRQLWLAQGNASNNGLIEFRAAGAAGSTPARTAYFGWGDANTIALTLEGANQFNVTGGGIWCDGFIKANTGSANGFLIGDAWHGIVWENNSEVYRSYQGKWEFRKTNGSLPGTLTTWIDGNTHGRVAGINWASATVTPAVGAFRAGSNVILYNDSIVCWHCSWESGFPTNESSWTTVINASGYSDFLRPPVKLEQWQSMPDSTGNATSVGLGFEIATDGTVKMWKPKDGPDIKAGIVANISLVYPRKS